MFLRPVYHFLAYNLLYRYRLNRTVTTSVNGFELVIEPSVMHPAVFKSGMIFSRYLSTLDLRGKRVLDLGTGSGILALSAAARGARVTASDINPLAVRCVMRNAQRNGFHSTIITLEGHLFAPVTRETYDVIVFNPPYFGDEQQASRDPALYGGRKFSLIGEFAREAFEFLNPGGYLLLILSTDSNIGQVLRIFSDCRFSALPVHHESTLFENFTVYKFTRSIEMESVLACPSCRGRLELSQESWECRNESLSFVTSDGIPDFVLPSRRAILGQFLQTYQTVRRNERWGSKDPLYYFELPYRDITDEHSAIWAIRARSYECLIEHLAKEPLDPSHLLLDLGAGNCWLSVRLSRLGYRVVAVDVNTDSEDGIGTAQRLRDSGGPGFQWLRAEFKFLPFAERSFSSIIFNASLHYAPDPYETVMRTLPLLNDTGSLYILDSPIYNNVESGESMVKERIESFTRDRSGAVPKESAGSYLTFEGLDQLKAFCVVDMIIPSYGLLWSLRPFIARLRGRRRPATFALIRVRHRGTVQQDSARFTRRSTQLADIA